MKFLIRTALMVGAVWLTFWVVKGLTFDGSWWALVILALLIALANAVVIPILKLIAIPIRIMTLGLATLVINILVIVGIIALAGAIDEFGITSDGFWWNVLGALILTILSSIISFFFKD